MNQPRGNHSKVLPNIIAVVFYLVAIWLLLTDKTGGATASGTIATIALLIANLDRLESIKGFGIEAKTRNLRSAIDDAESTMTKLDLLVNQLKEQEANIEALQHQLAETKKVADWAHVMSIMNK